MLDARGSRSIPCVVIPTLHEGSFVRVKSLMAFGVVETLRDDTAMVVLARHGFAQPIPVAELEALAGGMNAEDEADLYSGSVPSARAMALLCMVGSTFMVAFMLYILWQFLRVAP